MTCGHRWCRRQRGTAKAPVPGQRRGHRAGRCRRPCPGTCCRPPIPPPAIGSLARQKVDQHGLGHVGAMRGPSLSQPGNARRFANDKAVKGKMPLAQKGIEQGMDEASQAFLEGEAGQIELPQGRRHLVQKSFDHRQEKSLFAAEMVVNIGLRTAGADDDVIEADALVALSQKQFGRHRPDPLTAFLAPARAGGKAGAGDCRLRRCCHLVVPPGAYPSRQDIIRYRIECRWTWSAISSRDLLGGWFGVGCRLKPSDVQGIMVNQGVFCFEVSGAWQGRERAGGRRR